MARFLFAWELGGNYGHLGRCVAVAQELRERGHQVLFAVRDLRIASEQLGRAGLRYLQAPMWGRPPSCLRPPVNYAEMLLAEGYGEPASLWGALQGWVSLLQLYRPDVLIIDHAPTALLARHVVGVPTVVVGTGFEIPPDTEPMPSIRPWEEVAVERLRGSEQTVLKAINRALAGFDAPPLARVGVLFEVERCVLATFPELDHYGYRPAGQYAGASFGCVRGAALAWARPDGPHVLAYLRARTPGFEGMLAALEELDAEVICIVPGSADHRPARKDMRWASHLIDLERILPGADLAVTNAGAGMTAQL